MWSMWASVHFKFLRRLPLSVKQTEYLPIPSAPDRREPSAWSEALFLPRRSQRMIPQKPPLTFFSSRSTSASAPGVGRLRQSLGRSVRWSPQRP